MPDGLRSVLVRGHSFLGAEHGPDSSTSVVWKGQPTMTFYESSELRTTYALERLLDGGWRTLAREMVRHWPMAAPLDHVLAITSAAASIERNFTRGSQAYDAAADGYRVASLLAVDYHAMQSLGMEHSLAAHFLDYWKLDPFFLDI